MSFNINGLNLAPFLNSNESFEHFANTLSYIGQVLIDDDAHDFGYFEYFNRPGHQDHPSPFHHWQWGTILVFIGEAFKYIVEMLDIFGIQIQEAIQKLRNWLNKGQPKTLSNQKINQPKLTQRYNGVRYVGKLLK